MAEFVIPEYLVATDRLRVGVFIRLEGLKWYEHPFLFKSFKISEQKQIQTLKAMGIKEVICVPGKSDILPLQDQAEAADDDGDDQDTSTVDELWRIKKERAEQLKKRQEKIAQCEKRYVESQERIGGIMTGISAGNLAAVNEAAGICRCLFQELPRRCANDPAPDADGGQGRKSLLSFHERYGPFHDAGPGDGHPGRRDEDPLPERPVS